MSITTFNYIVEPMKEECMDHTTNFKKPISVEERRIVTIRYVILLVLKNNQHYKTLHEKIKNIGDNYEASRIFREVPEFGDVYSG